MPPRRESPYRCQARGHSFVTAYNRMFRCEGGQKYPNDIVNYPRDKSLGQCIVCKDWFRLYPNGRVVMHKRKSRT